MLFAACHAVGFDTTFYFFNLEMLQVVVGKRLVRFQCFGCGGNDMCLPRIVATYHSQFLLTHAQGHSLGEEDSCRAVLYANTVYLYGGRGIVFQERAIGACQNGMKKGDGVLASLSRGIRNGIVKTVVCHRVKVALRCCAQDLFLFAHSLLCATRGSKQGNSQCCQKNDNGCRCGAGLHK